MRPRNPVLLLGGALVVLVLLVVAATVGRGDDGPAAAERTAARVAARSTDARYAAVATEAPGARSRSTTTAATSTTTSPDAAAGARSVATTTTTGGSATPTPDDAVPDRPLAGRTVVIDPGHNGGNAAAASTIDRTVAIGNGTKACDTTGTESVRGQSEHAFNWSVAKQVRSALRRAGARVVLTRSSDRGVGPCITRRMPRANALGADVAVSIHADGGPAGGRGFHVILPGRVPQIPRHDRIVAPSARLGRAVRAAFRSGTGMPYSTYLGHRGLDVRTDLGGLNLIRVPGVMIETGNMRNATDARLLADPAWRARAARSIAAGVETWLTAESR